MDDEIGINGGIAFDCECIPRKAEGLISGQACLCDAVRQVFYQAGAPARPSGFIQAGRLAKKPIKFYFLQKKFFLLLPRCKTCLPIKLQCSQAGGPACAGPDKSGTGILVFVIPGLTRDLVFIL